MHFVNKEYKLGNLKFYINSYMLFLIFITQSICLDCIAMNEDHTAENLSDVITLILLDLNINNDKISAITTDYTEETLLKLLVI